MTDPNADTEAGGASFATSLLAECLLMLCWYLDDASGGHYDPGTRRDFYDGIADDLSKGGDSILGVLEQARDRVIEKCSSHPLSKEIAEAIDRFLGGVRYLMEEPEEGWGTGSGTGSDHV